MVRCRRSASGLEWSIANPEVRDRRPARGPTLCLLFNADAAEASFVLPPATAAGAWRVAIDTAADSPDDVAEPGTERNVPADSRYRLAPRSLVVLLRTGDTTQLE